ncbi:MAG TPA: TetR family transcriptional regulator [Solirubrobacterales bacterium]|jgi:AcrR family transcriptional regulator
MMSPIDDKATTLRRPHDSAATREALLDAAREVFDELGYERATTREIGERAGVDPSLIARYFDCKEGLFLATISEVGSAGEDALEAEPEKLLAYLLERWDERGHSPISRALASPALTEEVRDQVRAAARERLLRRTVELLRERGVAEPELRAELILALAVGVAMTRANGTLEGLAGAPREEILAVLGPFLDALAGG